MFSGGFKCGRRDSNPHALRRQILSLVRLPITPLPHRIFIWTAKITLIPQTDKSFLTLYAQSLKFFTSFLPVSRFSCQTPKNAHTCRVLLSCRRSVLRGLSML